MTTMRMTPTDAITRTVNQKYDIKFTRHRGFVTLIKSKKIMFEIRSMTFAIVNNDFVNQFIVSLFFLFLYVEIASFFKFFLHC